MENGVAYTIEKAPAFGSSEISYNNKELDSYSEVYAFAQSMIYRHKNTRYVISLELDFENGPQNYSSIDVGKTINLKLPSVVDTSICDLENLVIESIQSIIDESSNFKQRILINIATREV